jgi:hypothetical protein
MQIAVHLPALAAAWAAPATPAVPAAAQPAATGTIVLRGTVGVCLRWGSDPDHVAAAVVVVPSGNDAVDEAVPQALRTATWRRGAGVSGQWMGAWMAIGERPRQAPPPDCSRLPAPAGPGR